MASGTEEVAHVELSSQEKAELDEMAKDAKNLCVSMEIVNKSRAIIGKYKDENITEVKGIITPYIMLGGVLKSQTKGPLTLFDSKLWAGNTVGDYPNPLNSIGGFAQVCSTYDGIKAAVFYTGKNSHGVECGWLLAWADSNNTGRKIYAECSRKSKFNCIDWGQIDNRLKNSGIVPVTRASDSETGTSLYAMLYGVDLLFETSDTLTAVFCG
ncbi:jasmonate-induced protein homolog [Chenopodium quinoa]|uniref:Uncharacterized protein n=1 Tax=Chenopodium quinoa TaxID=63459 RepID=A0A803KUT2_CHEQI|nr:jasmonate-induced protein homolog [Chenopodium quinoa]